MAKMYMLTETSPFMMSFVLETDKYNLIIVDGGRKEDMPLLKSYVKNRHISAWILTHAHDDHIEGFVSEMERNSGKDFDVEKIYYNFPSYDELILKSENDVPDIAYFRQELNEMLPAFNKIKHKFKDKEIIAKEGDKIEIDEISIEFLYSYKGGMYANLMNDASLVFKVVTPKTSVLFLGDLGPDGGDELKKLPKEKLKADYVQMAHHGHMCVEKSVYELIKPSFCLWTAPIWLYEEVEIPDYLENRKWHKKVGRDRMWGTALTRKWMKELGVKKHYVSGEGTQVIEI